MKTNTKHTKGPWKVQFRELTGQYHINFNGKNELMDSNDFNANAALIAAAPEMFEALMKIYIKLCSEQFQYLQNDFENELVNIEKAIQKAGGE